ncbi:MAG: anti-sigma factor [Chloroflexi bacterium]|nr:anti-sigma factor [Chloroflexota bacterium]
MSGLTCDEVRELTPLHALNVLDVDERDVVDDHLRNCPTCETDLASYLEVTAQLALALPQSDPSTGLKDRVLAQARKPRALPSPPLARGGAPIPIWQSTRAQRLRSTLTSLVAGVAVIVAAGSSYWAYNLQSQLDAQNARIATLTERAQNYQRVASVLQAADTQIRVLQSTQPTQPAFGRVYIDPETSEGMLMVRNLPPLPPGRVYQLWVARANGERESAGILTWTDKAGNGYTLIKCPDALARWNTFGVTEEPTGGSPAPTGSRLLGGTI